MPFAALEDGFHDSPKILAAGNAAVGVYARALSYCVDQLTDGFVPAAWAKANAKPAELKALATAELWVPVKAGAVFNVDTRQGEKATVRIKGAGFFIRDFCAYNDTKAYVEKRREEKREAGKKGAAARWPNSKTVGSSHSTSHSSADGVGSAGGNGRTMPPVPVPVPVPNEPQEEIVLKDVGEESEDGEATIAALTSTLARKLIQREPAADDDIPF